jgi:hypothetical protein
MALPRAALHGGPRSLLPHARGRAAEQLWCVQHCAVCRDALRAERWRLSPRGRPVAGSSAGDAAEGEGAADPDGPLAGLPPPPSPGVAPPPAPLLRPSAAAASPCAAAAAHRGNRQEGEAGAGVWAEGEARAAAAARLAGCWSDALALLLPAASSHPSFMVRHSTRTHK